MDRQRSFGPLALDGVVADGRLDRTLANVFGISRGEARRIIATGGAWLDGRRCKVASRVVGPGQVVECHRRPDGVPHEPRVLFEDGRLAVIDKPPGVPSGPTRASDRGHVVSWAEQHFAQPIHLPHRLDRRASGLLLLVLDRSLDRDVAAVFRDGAIERVYRVRTDRRPEADEARLEHVLDGKDAALRYRVCADGSLEVRLETGRTHQIRRQLAAIGCPVSGDPRYGGTEGPLRLRAVRLVLTHPGNGERLVVEGDDQYCVS